jgi:hypothetical protein
VAWARLRVRTLDETDAARAHPQFRDPDQRVRLGVLMDPIMWLMTA